MPSIEESESWQGEPVLSVTGLSIEPYGVVEIKTDDRTDGSRLLAEELLQVWDKLWPEVRVRLEKGFVDYKMMHHFGKETLLGTICRRNSDCSDNPCDFCLSFVFDAEPGYPEWDLWVKGNKVVSWQPVF